MIKGRHAMAIKTLLLIRRSDTHKGVVVPCMNSVTRWDECYNDEHEVQPFEQRYNQNTRKVKKAAGFHILVQDILSKGHEWVMNDVPDGAARFDYIIGSGTINDHDAV
ncbi:hypothetical protein E3N88_41695 [Mikania micrantha]|uniref:Uncharacterized protein n=1 Tax=Mikania micrantha TaxID=192012 RepID=A0A5N6LKS0_9ASTR|nr:hypothetical protein E3N88_41695 [Mikania micrantha]